MQAVAAQQVARRQVTELPVIEPVIIEIQHTVVYQQHQQHGSYERTETIRRELFHVELSAGRQAAIIQRAGQAAGTGASGKSGVDILYSSYIVRRP